MTIRCIRGRCYFGNVSATFNCCLRCCRSFLQLSHVDSIGQFSTRCNTSNLAGNLVSSGSIANGNSCTSSLPGSICRSACFARCRIITGDFIYRRLSPRADSYAVNNRGFSFRAHSDGVFSRSFRLIADGRRVSAAGFRIDISVCTIIIFCARIATAKSQAAYAICRYVFTDGDCSFLRCIVGVTGCCIGTDGYGIFIVCLIRGAYCRGPDACCQVRIADSNTTFSTCFRFCICAKGNGISCQRFCIGTKSNRVIGSCMGTDIFRIRTHANGNCTNAFGQGTIDAVVLRRADGNTLILDGPG